MIKLLAYDQLSSHQQVLLRSTEITTRMNVSKLYDSMK